MFLSCNVPKHFQHSTDLKHSQILVALVTMVKKVMKKMSLWLICGTCCRGYAKISA